MENNPLAECSEYELNDAIIRLEALQGIVGSSDLWDSLEQSIIALKYFRDRASERETRAISQISGKYLFVGNDSWDQMRALVRYILENRNITRLHVITHADRRNRRIWQKILNEEGYYDDITVDSWNNIEKYEDLTGAFIIFDGSYVYSNGKWAKIFKKLARNNDWVANAPYNDNWLDHANIFVACGFYKNRAEFLKEHVVFEEGVYYPKLRSIENLGKLVELLNRIRVLYPNILESDPA